MAERCSLIEKKDFFVGMTGGVGYTPGHRNACKFVKFQLTVLSR